MASAETSLGPITSIKIHVDNDFVEQNDKNIENTNEEVEDMEEGEASEDEVQVNVIVGKPITDESYFPNENSKPPARVKKHDSWNNNMEVLNSLRRRKKDDYEDHVEFELPNNEDYLKEERASRFGMGVSEAYIPRSDLIRLYKSLGIDEDDFNRGGWRSDAIHMRGIDGMETEDIFDYFKNYSPNNIEWLNSNSCNVVWNDKKGPARALLGLSCPIRQTIKKTKTHSDDKKRKPAQESENYHHSQKPPKEIKSQSNRIKEKSKSPSDDSNSSSSGDSSSSSDESSSSSDESEDEKNKDNSSSSSDSEDSSSSSGSSSSGSGSSSSDSSDSENESTKMDTDEPPKVKILSKIATPQPRSKNSIRITVGNDVTAESQPQEDGTIAAEDIGVPIPSGRWRLGVPCPFSKAIFLRFAHCKDKKTLGLKKNVELNKKYSKRSTKYRSPPRSPRRRQHRQSPRPFKPEFYERTFKPPPPEPPRHLMPDYQREPEESSNFYDDLDDPYKLERNPWGFLAQNWGRKETQDSLDYQALLREHVTGKKRKQDYSSESDDEPVHKRLKHPSRAHLRDQDFTCVSPPMEYSKDDDDDDEYDGRSDDPTDELFQWRSKIKLPRMRMYADTEEKRKERRKPTAVLKRIGSIPRTRSLYPRPSPNVIKEKGFDLRAKLQNRKHRERPFRTSFSGSE